MIWIALIFAGLFETAGVTMIHYWNTYKNWQSMAALVISFAASFLLLAIALEQLPMGTAYAIWTGIGTIGSIVIGMLFFHESKDWKRILLIALILLSVIGLKVIS